MAGIEASAQSASPSGSSGARYYLDRSLGSAIHAFRMADDPLLREWFRQSLLAAAREDFGLTIGDAWAHDVRPPADVVDAFDIVTSPGKENLVELLRGTAPHQRAVAQFTMPPMTERRPTDYLRILTEVDRLVREQVAPKLAEAIGAAKPSTASDRNAASPELRETVERLEPLVNTMTFPTQFAAARELHRLVKQHGEAPELMGLLVRAYANLGLLTEPYYGTLHRTFKARALVYAQRWTVREAQSPRSLAHRAYAWTMVGLPYAALDDLAEVRRRAEEGLGGAGDVPAWTSIIDAACRYQLATLAATPVDDPHHELANLLRYVDVTRTGDTARITTAVIETYNAAPEAYCLLDDYDWIIDVSYIFENADVDTHSPRRELYNAQRQVLGQQIYNRTKAMVDLPPAVAELLADYDAQRTPPSSEAEYALRGKLISALLETPPADDVLPWSLYGRIVQEVSFRQAMESEESDPENHGDLPKQMLPLVAAHRFRPYFQVRDVSAPDRDERLKDFAKGVDKEELDRGTIRLLAVFTADDGRFTSPVGMKLYGEFHVRNGSDHTVRDLIWEFNSRYHSPIESKLKTLFETDPYNPNGIFLALKYIPEKYADRLEAWKILADDFPQIDALLTRQLAAAATPEEQEQKLLALFEKNPDPELARRLSELQLARNDVDAWEKTLRSFIARAAKSDEAMKACVGAASTLIGRRMFERAVPFVEALEERSYYPANRTVAAVYEGLQNWEAAEKAIRRLSEYSFSARCEWFFFCKRTGQGDKDAAFELAQAYVTLTEKSSIDGDTLGLFAILQREPERALPHLRANFLRVGDPLWGLHAVLLYDELGNTAERDQYLKEVCEKGLKYKVDYTKNGRVRTGIVELAKLITADLAAGGKAEFDAAAIEKLRADYPADRGDFDCLLGVYYDRRGRADLAAQSWLKCMASTRIVSFSRTLSGYRLWDRAVAPAEYRDALQGRTPAAKQE